LCQFHIEILTNVHKVNSHEIEKLKNEIDTIKLDMEKVRSNYNDSSTNIENKNKEIVDLKAFIDNLMIEKDDFDKLKKNHEDNLHTISLISNENQDLKKKIEEIQSLINEKDKKLTEFNELTKLFNLTDNNFLSSTKNNTNNIIPAEFQLNSLAITSNFYVNDDFVSIKKLEKGKRAVFVPHSAGIYVSINLNSFSHQENNQGNFDSNIDNKFYKCNAILSLELFEEELKELLMEHSLIIIGRIGKITDHYATSENNPYSLPEENNYLLCELDKIDYILGFQGEEMIFRNYIY